MPSAGDLTSTLALGQPPDTSVPQLPLASLGDLKGSSRRCSPLWPALSTWAFRIRSRRRTPCRYRRQARPSARSPGTAGAG